MEDPSDSEIGARSWRRLSLENPFVWFLFQVVEFAILVFLVLPILESVLPHGWPRGAYIAIWLALLVGLVAMNYRIRSRYVPR